MGGNKELPKANFNRALSYMVKSYVGPGCLSLPLAFQWAGVSLGMVMLSIVFAAVVWNLRSILLCKRFYEQHGVRSYADLGQVTYGRRCKNLIETLINMTQLGICSVYFDFVAENLHGVLPRALGPLANEHACMVYIFPVFSSLALLPSVDSIAPYTGLANFLVFATIVIAIGYAMVQLGTEGVGEGLVQGRPMATPLFFATAVYSFEGICNLLPVENALENKAEIFQLLYISMALVAVVYVGVGLLCYLAWPLVDKGSITAYLALTHEGSFLVGLMSWMVMISVVLTFPVQLFPSVELLEQRMGLQEAPTLAPGGFGALESGEAQTNPAGAGGGAGGGGGGRSRSDSFRFDSGAALADAASNSVIEPGGEVTDEVVSSVVSALFLEVDPGEGESPKSAGGLRRLHCAAAERNGAPPQTVPPPSPPARENSSPSTAAAGPAVVAVAGAQAGAQGGAQGAVFPSPARLARPLLPPDDGASSDDLKNVALGGSGGNAGSNGGSPGSGNAGSNGGGSPGSGNGSGNGGGSPGCEWVEEPVDLGGVGRHRQAQLIAGDLASRKQLEDFAAPGDGRPLSPPSVRRGGGAQGGGTADGSEAEAADQVSMEQKLFRVGLVFASGMFAALVPNLGALIALIGALSGSMLAIILPALINLRCPRVRARTELSNRVDYALLLFGVVGGLWGSALAFAMVVSGDDSAVG